MNGKIRLRISAKSCPFCCYSHQNYIPTSWGFWHDLFTFNARASKHNYLSNKIFVNISKCFDSLGNVTIQSSLYTARSLFGNMICIPKPSEQASTRRKRWVCLEDAYTIHMCRAIRSGVSVAQIQMITKRECKNRRYAIISYVIYAAK